MKRQATDLEGIFAKHRSDSGLIFKIYRLLHSSLRKQTTQIKTGQKLWKNSSPNKTYSRQVSIGKDA